MQKWPSIDPGRMKHWVTIEQQADSTDASGSIVIWADLVSGWAAIEVAGAREVIQSGQNVSQVPIMVRMYWQPEIRSNMRVRTNNGTYLIQGLQNIDEMNLVLILYCVALGEND